MYDLHNHLLPGIDDGSPDVETSLNLARLAVEDGITHMVCTPHIHAGVYDNNQQTINHALQILKKALSEQDIPLTIAAAAEIRIDAEIMLKIKNQELPFLGKYQGNDVLLLEFPSNAITLGSEKLTHWLLQQNITPMIAHPERNSVFQKNLKRVDEFLQQGCLIQITAGALEGNFGTLAKECAEQLIKEDKVTIIASDAHNIKYRPPSLSKAAEIVSQLVSEDKAIKLLKTVPKQISQSKFFGDTK